MEQSKANDNEIETSSCTKICSSERGGNIQHEETNAVRHSNVADDGLETRKAEADIITICMNASNTCGELEHLKENVQGEYREFIGGTIRDNRVQTKCEKRRDTAQ